MINLMMEEMMLITVLDDYKQAKEMIVVFTFWINWLNELNEWYDQWWAQSWNNEQGIDYSLLVPGSGTDPKWTERFLGVSFT